MKLCFRERRKNWGMFPSNEIHVSIGRFYKQRELHEIKAQISLTKIKMKCMRVNPTQMGKKVSSFC